MSCERHPNSGVVWVGDEKLCYGCYCEPFEFPEYCPLCGYAWDDPKECKLGESQPKEGG